MTRWTDWFYFRIFCISMVQTFIKPKSKEIKNLTAGPWIPFSSYRSFYRTPRIIFPSNYLHSTLVLAHTSTWSNHNFSCQHSRLQLLDRQQTPTPHLSKFIFGYTHLRLLSSIHLVSLPQHTSEPLMTPFYQSEIPSPMTYCKYVKIYIKPQDIQEAHPG